MFFGILHLMHEYILAITVYDIIGDLECIARLTSEPPCVFLHAKRDLIAPTLPLLLSKSSAVLPSFDSLTGWNKNELILQLPQLTDMFFCDYVQYKIGWLSFALKVKLKCVKTTAVQTTPKITVS